MRDRIESLWYAAIAGDLERVQAIVEEGRHDVDGNNYWQADIDPRGWQRTPLFAAVTGGHLALARWLLEEGAQVDLQTKYGDTALNAVLQPPLSPHWFEAVSLLIEHGATPTITNDEGKSALHHAQATPAAWDKVALLFQPWMGAEHDNEKQP